MKTLFLLSFLFSFAGIFSQTSGEEDIFSTPMGKLKISCIGHGTLMFQLDDYTIHIDPVTREADYSTMPKADLVLVTHEHGDHLDGAAIERIYKESTIVVMTETCREMLEGADKLNLEVMANGDKIDIGKISIEAIPAYNIEHKRSNGMAFHPEGKGNGYIIDMDGFRILVAGDTENTPEIKALKNIDVAFLPMNLPYTMTPEMVADAASAFKPKFLYPYHYGKTDLDEIRKLMKDVKGVELRIREL